MYANREKYLRDDMIHPKEEGVKLLGNAVAGAILKCRVSGTHCTEEREKRDVELCEKTIQ